MSEEERYVGVSITKSLFYILMERRGYDCTANFIRCSMKTRKLTSSVKMA